jgi:hypothetical protein
MKEESSTWTGETDNPRYRNHYGWLHLLADSEAARRADRDSEEFRRALTWYANYRWLFGRRNAFLDRLLDSGEAARPRLDREEFRRHYREFLIKGTRWLGWM